MHGAQHAAILEQHSMQSLLSEPLLHRMKILIIDDEAVSVRMLEELLHRRGYTRTRGLTNSREAMEACETFDPDLILLDLIMPETDGFTLLETIRSSQTEESFLPIVVLTADASETAKERALEAGATDFLVKPVSPTEALLRIRNLLETRRLHIVLENQRSALEETVRKQAVELRTVRDSIAT